MKIISKNKMPAVHYDFFIFDLVHLPTEVKLTVCNQIVLNFHGEWWQ
jgi:hypothetical protein